MKKAMLALLFVVVAALFLSGVGPPYEKRAISFFCDGEAVGQNQIRVEVTHALRAKRAGGYQNLYEQLLKKYDAKEALNYLGIGLGDYLQKLSDEREVKAVDAAMQWTGSIAEPFLYCAERGGRALNLKEAGRVVARAMDQGKARVYLCTHEVTAKSTLAKLR